MHKKISTFSKIMTTAFVSFLLLLGSSNSMAGSKTIPVEDMRYNTNTSIHDNLALLKEKRVTLTLDGGKVITGIVKSIGGDLVHLKKIERKEYYDALIRIKNIQAIEARFRTLQRK